jgi:hypothetical protein
MKILLLVIATSLAFIASSCRKERTCDCKTTTTEVRTGYGEQTTIYNSTVNTKMAKQYKNEFAYTTDCFSQTYTYNESGGNGLTAWSSVSTVVSTCDLK